MRVSVLSRQFLDHITQDESMTGKMFFIADQIDVFSLTDCSNFLQ
jgi:hypothetical protein